MSDEITFEMAQQVAIALRKMSADFRKVDPDGHIATVGNMLVVLAKDRDDLRAEREALAWLINRPEFDGISQTFVTLIIRGFEVAIPHNNTTDGITQAVTEAAKLIGGKQ